MDPPTHQSNSLYKVLNFAKCRAQRSFSGPTSMTMIVTKTTIDRKVISLIKETKEAKSWSKLKEEI